MISGATYTCGLLGYPIAHSKSPALHNAWFLERNINGVYLPLIYRHTERLPVLLQGLMGLDNFLGLNITTPHKNSVFALHNSLGISVTDVCKRTGSTNCLSRCGNGWQMDNTDIDGVESCYQRMIRDAKTKPESLIVLGCGGSLNSILFAPSLEALPATVMCRNPQQARNSWRSLDRRADVRFQEFEASELSEPTLVVNALPFGHNKETNIYANQIFERNGSGHFFFDLIYQDTPALQKAQECQWIALNGRLMLEVQAIKSFELFVAGIALTSTT